jgi:hypothetical protein
MNLRHEIGLGGSCGQAALLRRVSKSMLDSQSLMRSAIYRYKASGGSRPDSSQTWVNESATCAQAVQLHAGYFQARVPGTWRGGEVRVGVPPAYGPSAASPELGICTIGAVPWVVNFNMLLKGASREAGTIVASVISESLQITLRLPRYRPACAPLLLPRRSHCARVGVHAWAL